MLIGELSKRTGFSRDTIRWYEKIGLIKTDRKARTSNNYRQYNQATLDRLMLIKQVKSFGFTLKETEEILFLKEVNTLNCASMIDLINPKLQHIAAQIASLQQLQAKLITAQQQCSGRCAELFRTTQVSA